MGEERGVNAATSYGVDSNWYADSSGTNHVTGELGKLAVKDTYNNHNQIYTTSGSGMHITHICQCIICTPYRNLALNHVLHSPQASKNLASIRCITSNNNVFLSFILIPFFYQGSRIEENSSSMKV
jgi:hypothetical protein